jgi:hypothetical protein
MGYNNIPLGHFAPMSPQKWRFNRRDRDKMTKHEDQIHVICDATGCGWRGSRPDFLKHERFEHEPDSPRKISGTFTSLPFRCRIVLTSHIFISFSMPGDVDRDRLHWVNSCTESMGKRSTIMSITSLEETCLSHRKSRMASSSGVQLCLQLLHWIYWLVLTMYRPLIYQNPVRGRTSRV